MMTLFENVKQLFAASYWANETLLHAIPDEYLDVEVRSSFPSIRKTFNHIWDADTAWYYRLTFNTADPGVSAHFQGSNEAWRKEILASSRRFIDHLAAKEASYLDEILPYKTRKGDAFQQPVYQVLHHAINHATMHRGQIVTMLRNQGYEGNIPAMDFLVWYRSV